MPKKGVIPLTICQSSNIAAHGYDRDGQTLEIEFKSGSSYQYKGVTPDLYVKMQEAPSLGKFFQEHVRGKFETEKVGVDDEQAPA